MPLDQERKLTRRFTILRQCGRHDFSSILVLHDLLKSLQVIVERPSIDVFRNGMFFSYERLRFASLRALTWKTLFLVSLATYLRISDIHAFLYDLVDYNIDGSVTLRTDLIFMAKNQASGEELVFPYCHSHFVAQSRI